MAHCTCKVLRNNNMNTHDFFNYTNDTRHWLLSSEHVYSRARQLNVLPRVGGD